MYSGGTYAVTGRSTRTGAASASCSPGQLVHGLLEHLRVHLEADRGDVPALLVAEQVAGAADLEVGHGDLEAGAEVGVVAQRRAGAPRRRSVRRSSLGYSRYA